MVTLRIIDHVNCCFEGLTSNELKHCQKAVSYPIPGAFMTAAVKGGFSDGRESLLSDDGFTYIYMIDHLLTIMEEELEMDIDSMELVVESEPFELNVPLVDEDWLIDELGYKLREHQVEAINAGVFHKKGIFDLATNAGKTAICLGMSKLLDPFIKTVVIVPSEKLCNQTYADYAKSNLNVLHLTKKIKPKDREKKIREARHVIITLGLFQNCFKYFHEQYAIIQDECHIFGDVTAEILRFEMSHCPIRLGFTGTVPKDKLKSQKLKSTIGGGILGKVSPDELITNGFASQITIELFTTSHNEIEHHIMEMANDREFEAIDVYDTEENYLSTNVHRVQAIYDFIKSLETKNTLVLCNPRLGNRLASIDGNPYIDEDTSTDERERLFQGFRSSDEWVVWASYGTSSTGISEDRIFRLILIDVGKNETQILQSIGRLLRLDGVHNSAEVIDISADTKYSKKHREERLKIYRREKFPYTQNENFIMVG